MSARVEHGRFVVEFVEDRIRKEWGLPDKSDKAAIRSVRDEAVAFALQHGATNPGQTNAVKKGLTENDYHLTK